VLSDLLFRFRSLFRRDRVENELDDELRFHVDHQVEKLVGQGVSREDAFRQARLKLGGIEQAKENCRDARGVMLLETIAHDIRYAARTLRRSPGVVAAVTISLALGIGANTAIYSLMDAVMWRILPVKDPQGLMILTHGQGRDFGGGFTYRQYRLMREQNQSLAGLEAYSPARFNVSVDGGVEPTIEGHLVSGNYFSLLDVNPVAGRAIGPEDDLVPNGHPVAMISHGYWQRRFGLDREIIGRTIRLSGTSLTIIGVTPPEFFGLEVGSAPDIFLPLMMQPSVLPAFENLLEGKIYKTWLEVFCRLKPAVHQQEAITELHGLFHQEVPKGGKFAGMAKEQLALAPGAVGLSSLRRQFSKPLFVLMGIVGIVLLIACANTANLLLARAAARQREFAMRLTLGASRSRLVRQLLVESVMLALFGGVLGIVLASISTRFLVTFMSSGRSPIELDLNPDLHLLLFTAGISIATGIVLGIVPAMRSTRIDLTPSLKNRGTSLTRGRGELRSNKILAAAQVSLSLVLLIGAGLFIRSLQKLTRHDGVAARENVLVMRVEPEGSDQRGVAGRSDRLDRTYRDLLRRVRALPGVRSAGLAQFTPTDVRGLSPPVRLPSGEEKRMFVPMVYPGFFETAGIPMLTGRDFNDGDINGSSPAKAVVNEAFVRVVCEGTSPIGQQFEVAGTRREVIGVVRDSRYTDLRGETPAAMYLPFLQVNTGRGQMALYVRFAGDPGSITPQLKSAVQNIDPNMPLLDVRTLAEEVESVLVQERLIATLSSFFGALALLLASVGLYGLLSYTVVQRTGEMGIRSALGAKRLEIVWIVMREALLLVLVGIIVGVPVALAVGQVASNQISGLLYGLQSTDPLTITSACAVLLLVAVLASYLPARRASRVDPMVALRSE
jgi:predicted permease